MPISKNINYEFSIWTIFSSCFCSVDQSQSHLKVENLHASQFIKRAKAQAKCARVKGLLARVFLVGRCYLVHYLNPVSLSII